MSRTRVHRHPLAVALATTLLLNPLASAQRGDVEVRRLQTLEGTGLGPGRTPALDRRQLTRPEFHDAAGRLPAVLLTGYWPPTNEMLRHFSPKPELNPAGWQGANWEGRGYDVYAYFPTFVPPDCDNCGAGEGDLMVDYQDTSADFWPIADGVAPVAVITFSRGFPDLSWEVEMNQYNREVWFSDYIAPFQPTPAPPDTTQPAGLLIQSSLPVQAIVDAVNALPGSTEAFICFSGDGGGFLSEFIAYHGVWYQDLHALPSDPALCVAAGHVHVGSSLSVARARQAAEETLRVVLEHVDGILLPPVCQTDLGFAGPGSALLSLCGDALASGGSADLLLTGAPPAAAAWLALGAGATPTPFKGGTFVPLPLLELLPVATDGDGQLRMADVPGGGGPLSFTVQGVVVDAAQPQGYAFSNALEVELLP